MGEASMRKWRRWVRKAHAHEDLSPPPGCEDPDLWKVATENVIRARALHLRLRERRRREFLRTAAGAWLSSPRAMIYQPVLPVAFSGPGMLRFAGTSNELNQHA